MPPSIPYLGQTLVRQVFPSHADFREEHLPSQHGRVVIVTGSSSGMGMELARILYLKGATVYLAARSKDKLDRAYKDIVGSAPPNSPVGRLEILLLDLADLTSIKKSAEDFMSREPHLHVLVHNAGVMNPPANSRTKQGYDLEMGTNCLGPFLFTQFLLPTLISTTRALRDAGLPANLAASRIVWTSSISIFAAAPHGMVFDSQPTSHGTMGGPTIMTDIQLNYAQSKVGNVFHSAEIVRRYADEGIISIALDPGLLKTELQRNHTPAQKAMGKFFFKDAKYGAYTELFAGFSPEVTVEKAKEGAFVIPWGKWGVFAARYEEGDRGGAGEEILGVV